MRTIPMMAVLALSLLGCTGAGERPGEVKFSLTGADDIQLFDAQYSAYCKQNGGWSVVSAIVTIDEIDVKVNGKWVAVEKSPEQIDLLKLDHKTLSTLGIGTIPAGKVSGLRLVLDPLENFVVLKNGQRKPLTVPDNGIINVSGKLELDSCAMGTLILDFDPHIAAFTHPGLHDYILTCSAKIKTRQIKHGCYSDDMSGASEPDMAGPEAPDMASPEPDMTPPAPDMTETCNGTTACGGQTPVCYFNHCYPVGDPCLGTSMCPAGEFCHDENDMPVCLP